MTGRNDHQDRPRTLARSLGMFVGHILKGVRADPSKHDPEVIDRRTTTDETHTTGPENERITLRRTVIEEIEIERDDEDRSP